MANQTVYPYGTGGSLPSSIGVINDYITGGAENAFSAEMGKDINQRICEEADLLKCEVEYPGFFSADSYVLDSDTRYFDVIANDGYDFIEVVANESNATFVAFVASFSPTFASDDALDLCEERKSVSANTTAMFTVPSDCTHILVSVNNHGTDYSPSSVKAFTMVETEDDSIVLLDTGIVQGIRDTNTGEINESTSTNYRCTSLIDVSGYKTIRTNAVFNSGIISVFWYDSNGGYLGRMKYSPDDDGYAEIPIPAGANSVSFNLTSNSGDVSGARVYGIVGDTSEEEGINGDVYLSQFWDEDQTTDQNISDMMDFVSPLENKVVHFDMDVTISSVILLESNTTVYIDGVTIKQADGMFDNVFRSANMDLSGYNDYKTMPSVIDELENISIIGRGDAMIVGPDTNATDGNGNEMVGDDYGLRTWQICLVRLKGGEVSGITFTKTRCWAVTMELCSNIELHHLHFVTTVENGDGIDFRVGCKHCYVHDIYGYTEDDLIACTALGNLEYTDEGRTYVGTPTWKLWNDLVEADVTALYIDDITVKDVQFLGYGSAGHGMICLSAYGSKVQNVSISNFYGVGGTSDTKEALIKLYHGYGTGYTTGDINNIRMNNISSYDETYTLMVSGGVVTDVWANKLENRSTAANILSESTGNSITVTNS